MRFALENTWPGSNSRRCVDLMVTEVMHTYGHFKVLECLEKEETGNFSIFWNFCCNNYVFMSQNHKWEQLFSPK